MPNYRPQATTRSSADADGRGKPRCKDIVHHYLAKGGQVQVGLDANVSLATNRRPVVHADLGPRFQFVVPGAQVIDRHKT